MCFVTHFWKEGSFPLSKDVCEASACVCVSLCAFVCMLARQNHVHVPVHIYMCVLVFICQNVCMRENAFAYVAVCLCVCVCIAPVCLCVCVLCRIYSTDQMAAEWLRNQYLRGKHTNNASACVCCTPVIKY